jgi:hypothetical protein
MSFLLILEAKATCAAGWLPPEKSNITSGWGLCGVASWIR